MQDSSSHWYGDLQVTIELSQKKWPSYDKIDYYYKENKRSLLSYLSFAHQGAGFTFESGHEQLSGSLKIEQSKQGNWNLVGEFAFIGR